MKGILFLIALLSTTYANAGLLLEPYVGYNVTAIERGTDGTAAKGLMVGGRVGYTFLSTLFIAFDYSTGELSWEPEGGVDVELEGTMTRMGITAGADIPIAPLRAWAGYYKADYIPSGSGYKYKAEDGSGYKLGLGITVLPVIDINLEYFSGEYDTLNDVSVTDLKEKGLMVSISAPFDL
ncbi:MAG: outer membrane beta-barrel protein [Bdellovibrionales bacterium]|nr:outer membrane beta-barrel protein [Bdellovibrionales bacterium]